MTRWNAFGSCPDPKTVRRKVLYLHKFARLSGKALVDRMNLLPYHFLIRNLVPNTRGKYTKYHDKIWRKHRGTEKQK